MGNEQSRGLTEEERQAALQEGYARGQKYAERLRALHPTETEEKRNEPNSLEVAEGARLAAVKETVENIDSKAADAKAQNAEFVKRILAARAAPEREITQKTAHGINPKRKDSQQGKEAFDTAPQGSATALQNIETRQSDEVESPEGSHSIPLHDRSADSEPGTSNARLYRLPDKLMECDDPVEAWKPRKDGFQSAQPIHRVGTIENQLHDAKDHARRSPNAKEDIAINTNELTQSILSASTSSKRPLTDSGLKGLSDLPTIPKKQRTLTTVSASLQSPTSSEDSETRPPAWLNKYTRGKTSKLEVDSKSLTGALKKEITKVKDGLTKPSDATPRIRDKIHKLFFILVDEQTIRNNNLLANDNGLPQIFDPKYAGGVEWPHDIQADARELHNKWSDRIFETDLLHDIKVGKPKDANKEGADEGGSSVREGKRKSSKYIGNGKLLNGQWWPTLLCAYRDGAHGETVAGISGDSEEGAYSCFISGGSDVKYPDIDEGNTVYYCGTDNKKGDGTVTRGTKMMLDAMQNGHPVRFMRSSKARLDGKSEWAPEYGFRYDGLYEIVDYELLDQALARHRFKLVRCGGQGPIRGGSGPEARPTREEMAAYNKDKRLRGFK